MTVCNMIFPLWRSCMALSQQMDESEGIELWFLYLESNPTSHYCYTMCTVWCDEGLLGGTSLRFYRWETRLSCPLHRAVDDMTWLSLRNAFILSFTIYSAVDDVTFWCNSIVNHQSYRDAMVYDYLISTGNGLLSL